MVCPNCGNSNTMKPRQLELLSGGFVTNSDLSNNPLASYATPAVSDDTIAPIRARSTPLGRVLTGLNTLDKALGGGFVVSSSTLLAGDWGSGKSTLALRLAGSISFALYVASEENREQIEDRATRTNQAIGCPLLCTQKVDRILRALVDIKSRTRGLDKIDIVIIDSLNALEGRPIEIARDLDKLCKSMKIALVAVSQVVKDGSIAGPNELGHIFDTVLIIEKTENQTRNILVDKSRFAPSPVRYPLLLNEFGWVEPSAEDPQGSQNPAADTGRGDSRDSARETGHPET